VDSTAEPGRGAGFGSRGYLFAIVRWCAAFQGMNQASGNSSDFIDGSVEYSFVCFRRFVEAADFSHELERSRTNLLVGDRRIEIEKRFDASAYFLWTSCLLFLDQKVY